MFEAVVSQEGTVCQIRLNGEFDLEGFPRQRSASAKRSAADLPRSRSISGA